MVGNKLIVLLVFVFGGFHLNAQTYLEAMASPGDGISVLLQRYELLGLGDNQESFLKLNRLKAKDQLRLGKTYRLPIMVYTYNDTSIRTTLNITDLDVALNIQKYNEEMHKHEIKVQDYRKNKELWVPMHLMIKESSIRQTESRTFTPYKANYDIFGDKYQEVEVSDQLLKDRVYYLISGHGGPDPGALGLYADKLISEDEYAYDVTLRLARNLISHGAIVYVIIRDPNDGIRDSEVLEIDNDEVCYPNEVIPLNQMARLKQRTEAVNKLYYENKKKGYEQRTIAIHVDSRHVGKKIDLFFYHFPGSQSSEKLANIMLNTVKDKYAEHQKNREYWGIVKDRNLYVIREILTPLVYIELGNITNDYDQKRLVLENNRQALANWFSEGLINEAK
jgi:N-acetylmuramoyl-L-alanine amidase